MTKKNKSRNSTKAPRESAPKAASDKELSDGELDNVSGGAVNAFIWFNTGGDVGSAGSAGAGSASAGSAGQFETKDYSFGTTSSGQSAPAGGTKPR